MKRTIFAMVLAGVSVSSFAFNKVTCMVDERIADGSLYSITMESNPGCGGPGTYSVKSRLTTAGQEGYVEDITKTWSNLLCEPTAEKQGLKCKYAMGIVQLVASDDGESFVYSFTIKDAKANEHIFGRSECKFE